VSTLGSPWCKRWGTHRRHDVGDPAERPPFGGTLLVNPIWRTTAKISLVDPTCWTSLGGPPLRTPLADLPCGTILGETLGGTPGGPLLVNPTWCTYHGGRALGDDHGGPPRGPNMVDPTWQTSIGGQRFVDHHCGSSLQGPPIGDPLWETP
jgi:hypothetical protein